jgi:DDE_Tnp_1-associated
MDRGIAKRFQEHFGKIRYPRIERTRLYPLEEILFVMLCGSVCGAESWRDFVMFEQDKL